MGDIDLAHDDVLFFYKNFLKNLPNCNKMSQKLPQLIPIFVILC